MRHPAADGGPVDPADVHSPDRRRSAGVAVPTQDAHLLQDLQPAPYVRFAGPAVLGQLLDAYALDDSGRVRVQVDATGQVIQKLTRNPPAVDDEMCCR